MADTPLGGVDWDSYKRQGPETDPNPAPPRTREDTSVGQQWRDHLRDENYRLQAKHTSFDPENGDARVDHAAYMADPEYARITHLHGLVADTAGSSVNIAGKYQPLSLMHSDRWTYPAHKAEEEQAGLDELNKITARHGLPEGHELKVTQMKYGDGRVELHHNDREVGYVNWDTQTGHVHGMSVAQPYRLMTANLLGKAHEVSHEMGGTGPTSSDTLSAYSYKVMRNHAPSFIPKNASVEGEDADHYDDLAHAHRDSMELANHHWNNVKPHLQALAERAPDGAGVHQDIGYHEQYLSRLNESVNRGAIRVASDDAGYVRDSADRLRSAYGSSLPDEARDSLKAADEPLRKIHKNDFYDELGGR